MAPFEYFLCPNCKKKNEIDLATLGEFELGYKDKSKTINHEYYFICQHCHKPFKFTLEKKGDKNETKSGS
jgi:hypothetical protein